MLFVTYFSTMQYVIVPTRYGNACNLSGPRRDFIHCDSLHRWFELICMCAELTKDSLHRLQKHLTCNCVAYFCTGDLSALMTPPRRQIEGSENQTSLTAGVLLVLLKLAWSAQYNLKALDDQDVLLSWPCQIWWRLLKAQSLGIWQGESLWNLPLEYELNLFRRVNRFFRTIPLAQTQMCQAQFRHTLEEEVLGVVSRKPDRHE